MLDKPPIVRDIEVRDTGHIHDWDRIAPFDVSQKSGDLSLKAQGEISSESRDEACLMFNLLACVEKCDVGVCGLCILGCDVSVADQKARVYLEADLERYGQQGWWHGPGLGEVGRRSAAERVSDAQYRIKDNSGVGDLGAWESRPPRGFHLNSSYHYPSDGYRPKQASLRLRVPNALARPALVLEEFICRRIDPLTLSADMGFHLPS